MKLPDPVGRVVDWDSLGNPYVHWNTKPGSITNLFTEAQLREALAQQERDTVDGFAIAHMNGHDLAKRRYEAVMRQALDALKSPVGYGDFGLGAIKALEDALK